MKENVTHPHLLSLQIMTDDIVILNLCSELAKFGVRVNIDQLSENRYSKERLVEIKSTL